jgi:hypothetical protein
MLLAFPTFRAVSRLQLAMTARRDKMKNANQPIGLDVNNLMRLHS